jgi:hypothetical protein
MILLVRRDNADFGYVRQGRRRSRSVRDFSSKRSQIWSKRLKSTFVEDSPLRSSRFTPPWQFSARKTHFLKPDTITIPSHSSQATASVSLFNKVSFRETGRLVPKKLLEMIPKSWQTICLSQVHIPFDRLRPQKDVQQRSMGLGGIESDRMPILFIVSFRLNQLIRAFHVSSARSLGRLWFSILNESNVRSSVRSAPWLSLPSNANIASRNLSAQRVLNSRSFLSGFEHLSGHYPFQLRTGFKWHALVKPYLLTTFFSFHGTNACIAIPVVFLQLVLVLRTMQERGTWVVHPPSV